MRHKILLAGLLISTASFATAQTPNLYGMPGLIDLPEARPWTDGSTALTLGTFEDNRRVTLGFQITPRLTAAYRFSTTVAGERRRTDPALDLQFTLLKETNNFPAVALGIRELYGTGRQGAEYVVATKSIGPSLTVTGGFGWGRLAGEGFAENPISTERETIGRPRLRGDLFSGDDLGGFIGVSWALPDTKWRVQAEYSSDSYGGEDFSPSERLNFGIERDIAGGVSAGVYSIGGDEIAFRLNLLGDPRKPVTKQDFLPGPLPIKARPVGRSTDWAARPGIEDQVMTAIAPPLAAEGIVVEAGTLTSERVDLWITNTKLNRQTKAIGRVARVLATALPPSVETFAITLQKRGVPTSTTVVKRSDLERLDGAFDAGSQSWEQAEILDAGTTANWHRGGYPSLSYSLAPRVPFGLASEGLNFDLVLDFGARADIAPGVTLSAAVRQSLLGGFDDIDPVEGELPSVRSNVADYQSNGPVVAQLRGDVLTKLAPSLYARASAGYLERMFGGVSGELLWKPVQSPMAFGFELNAVQQRDPDEILGFDDYETVSGHGSVYWDTGWHGVAFQIDAGRYLAEDWGATVSLSRRFQNGWEVAGFVTATDAQDEGAVSGARLSIPLQWTSPMATRRTVPVTFRDFTRDDGARLAAGNRLYPIVRDTDAAWLKRNWGAFWQ